METLLDLINACNSGKRRINVSSAGLAILETGTVPGGVGVGIVWLGPWDSGTLYLEGDGVSRNGSTYIAIANNLNSAPPSVNWDLVAAKGDAGSAGAQGIAGADGAAGATGAAGPSLITALTATTLTGLLKGDGLLVSAAVAPTDYVATGDSRLSNARTPTSHATTHQPGGSDTMAVDAAAATGSLRTVGSGALQACSGTDSRLSDARTPTAHTHPEAEITNLVTDLAAKQPLDSDLTTIAGLTATTDNFMVSVASAWASRTVAQVKTTLALDNVTNTTDAGKPVSTAQQTALNLKADLASPSFSGTPSLPTGTTATTQAAADSTTKLATTAFATTADNLKANLASPTFTGTVTMPGPTINDATDITIGATTGTKIGQATSKIGFYGVAAAVRPTTLTQTYSTASATHPAITSTVMPAGGTGVAAGGWSTAANRDLAIAAFAADRTDLANLKNFVNQIVDQLQALGLLQ